jgi:hypothetical protein
MALMIHVHAYSGKANERPREFVLDDDYYEIVEVEDRWYETEAVYFRVRMTRRQALHPRYHEAGDEWTLQSGFDGDELLSRPSIELVTVDAEANSPCREAHRVMRALPPGRCRHSI